MPHLPFVVFLFLRAHFGSDSICVFLEIFYYVNGKVTDWWGLAFFKGPLENIIVGAWACYDNIYFVHVCCVSRRYAHSF